MDNQNNQQFDPQTYGQPQYNQQTYDQPQYNQQTYDQQGYNQQAYNQPQYNQQAYNQPQYNPQAYNQAQYAQNQYGQQQYNQMANTGSTSSLSGAKIILYSFIAGIVGCLINIISVFCPYASIELWGFKESVSLFDFDDPTGRDGIFFLILGIILIALFIFKKAIPTIIFAVINLILLFVEMGNNEDLKDMGAKLGAGYYLLLIGSIIVMIASVTLLIGKQKAKRGM